jgi:hypothetical protein
MGEQRMVGRHYGLEDLPQSMNVAFGGPEFAA